MSYDHKPISILECRRDSFYVKLDWSLQEIGKNGGILSDALFNDTLEAVSSIKEYSSEEESLEKLHLLDKKVTHRLMKKYNAITNSDSTKVMI